MQKIIVFQSFSFLFNKSQMAGKYGKYTELDSEAMMQRKTFFCAWMFLAFQ